MSNEMGFAELAAAELEAAREEVWRMVTAREEVWRMVTPRMGFERALAAYAVAVRADERARYEGLVVAAKIAKQVPHIPTCYAWVDGNPCNCFVGAISTALTALERGTDERTRYEAVGE